MQKNSISSIKKEKIYENIHNAYNKLLLLEEELDRKIDVYKKKDRDDVEDFSSEALSAVSLKLTWTKAIQKEKIGHIIKNGVEYIEQFKGGKDVYRVDEVIVDLTKVINIIKAVGKIDPSEIEKIEDMRKAFRYINTAVNQSNKIMKQVTKKREEARNKYKVDKFDEEMAKLDEEYYRKQEEIRNKYNIPDDFEKKIDSYAGTDELVAKADTNATNAEKEAKDTVRYVRELLRKYFDLPQRMIDELNVVIKAMGAIARVGTRQSRLNLPSKTLRELMEDPKIKEILEPYVKEVEYEDPVQIIGAKLNKMGTYFGEAHDKIQEIVKDIDEVGEEAKNISEGAIKDAISKSIKMVMNAIKASFNKLKSVTKSLKNNVFRSGSEIEQVIDKFNADRDETYKKTQINYVELEKNLSEFEMKTLKESIIARRK